MQPSAVLRAIAGETFEEGVMRRSLGLVICLLSLCAFLLPTTGITASAAAATNNSSTSVRQSHSTTGKNLNSKKVEAKHQQRKYNAPRTQEEVGQSLESWAIDRLPKCCECDRSVTMEVRVRQWKIRRSGHCLPESYVPSICTTICDRCCGLPAGWPNVTPLDWSSFT